MGEVRAKVILENDYDIFMYKEGRLKKEEIRSIKIDALMDTRAVMILLPQDMVEKLGIEKMGRTIVTLANDEKAEMDVAGMVEITIAGRKCSK